MLAEDATPNRLQRAKQYIRDLLDASHGDRVGLLTFAGVASIQCPLTLDYVAFESILENVQAQSAARGGSLLGDALRLAGESFTDSSPDSKAIIVLSDGEDHGSFPVEAARALNAQLPIPVFTIGLGDETQGARIPLETEQGRQYLMYQGEQVWSKMNAQPLREIALATGGAFIPVGTSRVDMARVYEQWIQPRAEREFDTTTIRYRHPQFQWFAGAALVLLLIESFMLDGRLDRVSHGVRLESES
jgi:Ca-activated chloride channel family protein